ncbi:hypothetical protein [Tropicibacter naphthalenivorans]|nr:hypothetical protein [Tropicibacter naphthalenivorans]
MRHPVTLIALAGTGAVLGLAGPFGTVDLLPLLPRLAYWIAVVTLTYGAGSLVNGLLRPVIRVRRRTGQVVLTGLAAGVAIGVVVLVLNWLVFGWLPSGDEAAPFAGTLLAISVIVTAALDLAAQHRAMPEPAAETPQEAKPTPPRYWTVCRWTSVRRWWRSASKTIMCASPPPRGRS